MSELALEFMRQHGVDPSPDNYAVWFEYVRGKNRELVMTIDALVNRQAPFSTHINHTLHKEYIATESKAVDRASREAQRLLASVMQAIDGVSGDTKDYGKALEQYSESLSDVSGDGDLQKTVDAILQKTQALKQKGDTLTTRLEESKFEVKQLRENLEKATTESQTDFLTGIRNRKAFDESLDEMMKTARLEDHPLSLLMIDIDHFKKFNDTYGHQIGDQVLKLVSHVITQSVKGRDIVARFGGEEFAVILPDTNVNGAYAAAENLRKEIASKGLRRKDTGEVFESLTVSIGVSSYRPHADKAEQLIERADKALYVSKNKGRNRVTSELPD